MTDRRERLLWTGALFAFAAIDGLALQARGALFVSFRETFGVSEGQLGLITPAGTVGFVLVVVAAGALAGRIDIRRWLLVGVVGSTAGFLLMGAAPSFAILLAMVFVRSVSTGAFRGLDRPVLSHLYPTARGRVFNLHTMAWAAGATLGPLAVVLFVALGNWRYTYVFLAALLVPVFVVVWRLELPASVDDERSFARSDVRGLLGHRAVVVMSLALVLVGGIESTFFTWLPYYAAQFYSQGLANAVLSVYLAAYVPGRYAYSRVTGRVHYPTTVLVSGVALLLALAVTFRSAGGYGMLAGIFLVGFLVSGLFPTLLAWGVDAVPEFTGPINAVALTAAQVGFFVFPATVGLLAEAYSIERAMLLQLGLTAVLVCTVVAGRWYAGR